MMVARNWVDDGFYGRYLVGQPAPPGLEGHYPVVASVALIFRFFGIGLWQARLPGVIYTFGAFALAFYLAFQLFGLRAGFGTLVVLLLFIARPEINPIMIGRQVLGDIPAVFFLLAGYTGFVLADRVSGYCLLLVMFFWGLALASKIQTLPFWLLAIVAPAGLLTWRRQWKLLGILLIAAFGSWLVYLGIGHIKALVLNGHTLSPVTLDNLFRITALVTVPSIRLESLRTALSFCLVPFVGLIFFVPIFLRMVLRKGKIDPDEILKFSLWLLAGSWFSWYILLSNGGLRYLAIPAFLSSFFAGAMLETWSRNFSIRESLHESALMVNHRQLSKTGVGAFGALILTVVCIPITLGTYLNYWMGKDDSAKRLAQEMNTTTAKNVLIESYDSEFLFYLDRLYHYPPDQIHVALLSRYLLGTQEAIDYSPLAANPDYIVVGEVSRDWGLYDPILDNGEFRLLKEEGRYQIYERSR